jgi:hypothetical protein
VHTGIKRAAKDQRVDLPSRAAATAAAAGCRQESDAGQRLLADAAGADLVPAMKPVHPEPAGMAGRVGVLLRLLVGYSRQSTAIDGLAASRQHTDCRQPVAQACTIPACAVPTPCCCCW